MVEAAGSLEANQLLPAFAIASFDRMRADENHSKIINRSHGWPARCYTASIGLGNVDARIADATSANA